MFSLFLPPCVFTSLFFKFQEKQQFSRAVDDIFSPLLPPLFCLGKVCRKNLKKIKLIWPPFNILANLCKYLGTPAQNYLEENLTKAGRCELSGLRVSEYQIEAEGSCADHQHLRRHQIIVSILEDVRHIRRGQVFFICLVHIIFGFWVV